MTANTETHNPPQTENITERLAVVLNALLNAPGHDAIFEEGYAALEAYYAEYGNSEKARTRTEALADVLVLESEVSG